MAITNYDRVTKTLDLLRQGLAPFVEREFAGIYGEQAFSRATSLLEDKNFANKPISQWDVAALLKLMWDSWNDVFRNTLGFSDRSLVSELREHRNKWAHQQPFAGDDAYRVLDSACRLLNSVSAPLEVTELERMKNELLRVRYDEQIRSEKRKSAGSAIESQVTGNLKPWREVVSPHKDVASGRYQQAEFAADLWQVHIGEGSDEYRKPIEFFQRTFLTDSLKQLLSGAMERLAGTGGDPVIQLQTNFGGGKTHSMLALYHLFSGSDPKSLQGIEEVMEKLDIKRLEPVKRVVLVGNKLSPGNPSVKPDGTIVRTLWGELAWQLGGQKAFARIKADDEKATSPGDVLRELFNEYGPCLVLIDEWVAYARQLHERGDLPGGNFETHFTFAQALTESAKLAKKCLLVISLPASDTAGTSHAVADDVEVGGERGRAALVRLRNAVGRVEASWRPASADEGFEIVRRRLFEPIMEKTQFVVRDGVAQAYSDMYRSQHQDFPPECRDADYERRLKAAYPIHPEVFDRLYTDWSTLVKFQRTRGVLRLMAAVIHSLWEKVDKNPMIMPSNIPIDDTIVRFELTRYLSDNWVPVIEKDVDGPHALPIQIDNENKNLGKYAACRRVARTIYLGSAPKGGATNLGVDDRRIKLGCMMPGEAPALFGDALRHLARAATYLYQDGTRYWYSTQPTVAKMAEDRAEQLKREPDLVTKELEKRLRANLRDTGDFQRVHPLPQSGQDIPDDWDARLVVLKPETAYTREPGNPAEIAARAILESRGNTPRQFRNALVFLAVDQPKLQDLNDAVRKYLAWKSIVLEEETLGLSHHQIRSATDQKTAADSVVDIRIPEAYQWLLVPTQKNPQEAIAWTVLRLTSSESLAVRASKKLKNEELLITIYAGTRLRMELDRIPLWRKDHVSIKQLFKDFASYPYLPRLADSSVLLRAIEDGLGLITWDSESFAYADGYDEKTGHFQGLRGGTRASISEDCSGLLVEPKIARQQMVKETPDETPSLPGATSVPTVLEGKSTAHAPATYKRFHGTVSLDSRRVGRDAGKIAEEVIAHLVGIVDSKVRVTLEIEAEIPGGAPDHVVRTVTENGRTLNFQSQAFEKE